MEKDKIFQTVRSMIVSSTHEPKYMSVSSVKLANLLDLPRCQIENHLNELTNEGLLRKEKLSDPPYREIFLLPEQG